MSDRLVKKVAIVGGTHGNELTGIYLIKKFQKLPELVQRSNFETLTILGNPKAITANKRFIDVDLNRCFRGQDLADINLIEYEQIRAKEIAQQLKEEKVDLLLDLHTTTANMGITLILNNTHPFLLALVAYLSKINPAIKILQYSQVYPDTSYLRNLCELGLAIEVGPVSQGVLSANLFKQTEIIISLILDYLEIYNKREIEIKNLFCTVYKQIAIIDYPRSNEGEIQGMIAPGVNDYQALSPGEPLFLSFNDQEIIYEGDQVVYPVFVGEAAYLEKGIAMFLTTKKVVESRV